MKKFVNNLATAAVLLLLALVASTPVHAQARFRSQANGSWGSAATWLLVAGSDADGIPDANDTVDVVSPYAVTLAGSNGDCGFLTVGAGGAVTLGGAGNLRVNANPGSAVINGTVTLSSSGSLNEAGSAGTRSFSMGAGSRLTISGSAAFPSFDSYALDPASTVEFTQNGNQTIKAGVVFGNLTLSGSGTKTVAPIVSDTTFYSLGTVTIGAGVTFDVSTNILKVYFQGDVINNGTLDASVGIVIVEFSGSQFVNNGTFLTSTTPGFGYTPSVTFNNTTVTGSTPQNYYDLIVNGPMTAGGNLTVTRNLIIMAGGTLNGGSGFTHVVGGDWTNSGTFNYGTSTVTFQGAALQHVGASTFYAVILNNAAGISLTGDVQIVTGGSMTLTSGNVATAGHILTVNASAPTALVLGANSITGTVARAIAPGSTGTYQFFGANAYVIPGGTGNPSMITATVYPNTNPPNLGAGADTNVIVKRYYTISGTGIGGGFFYTMRLSYAQSEVRGNEATYTMWENSGAVWVDVGLSSAPDTANNFAEQSGLTGFSDWTVASTTSALPIQLASFQGAVVAHSSDVRLTWTTLSELNNYGFYIQRSSAPSSGFVDCADNFVRGSGTSLTPKQYAWTEKNMTPGTYYYRLKQADLDGSITMSDPVKVVVETPTGVDNGRGPEVFALSQNYPNPFNPTTRIQFSVEQTAHATLIVYNILGDQVATLFTGTAEAGKSYTVAFDGSNLANGAYFCRLVSGEKTELKKMILLK
jgi:hypothetical protein